MAPSLKLAHGRPCHYCERTMDRASDRLHPTRDHVVPESQGGKETVICCYACNATKGDMMPEVWAAFMVAFPMWWTLSKAEIRRARRQNFLSPGFKPPKRTVPGIRGRPICVVPPELIYSTIKAQDAMLPSAAEQRESARTEKWGPRGARVIRRYPDPPSTPMKEALEQMIGRPSRQRPIDGNDQPPLSEPESHQ